MKTKDPPPRLFFANLHLLSLREQKQISQLFCLKEKEIVTEQKLRLFSEKVPSLRVSWLWDTPGFFVAFIKKKQQRKSIHYTHHYQNKVCLRAQRYWQQIVTYCTTCFEHHQRPFLSLRKGYYSYGRGRFIKEEQYFQSLSLTEYQQLQQVLQYDQNPAQRFYAALALHYWRNISQVYATLQREVKSNDSENQNTAGFFLLALGTRKNIPLKIILQLLTAEYQAPRTKGLYILAKYLQTYSQQQQEYISHLQELAQWKTPLIRRYARSILYRLKQADK